MSAHLSNQRQIQFSIVLFIFLTQILVCSADKQRYCGQMLTTKVIKTCNGCIHQEESRSKRRSVEKSKLFLFNFTYEIFINQALILVLTHRRLRRTIMLTHTCCFKPCSEEDIAEFCCTDEEKEKYKKA